MKHLLIIFLFLFELISLSQESNNTFFINGEPIKRVFTIDTGKGVPLFVGESDFTNTLFDGRLIAVDGWTDKIEIDGESYNFEEAKQILASYHIQLRPYNVQEFKAKWRKFTRGELLANFQTYTGWHNDKVTDTLETHTISGGEVWEILEKNNWELHVNDYWRDYSVKGKNIYINNDPYVFEYNISEGVENLVAAIFSNAIAKKDLDNFFSVQSGANPNDTLYLDQFQLWRGISLKRGKLEIAEFLAFAKDSIVAALTITTGPWGVAANILISENEVIEGDYIGVALQLIPYAGKSIRNADRVVKIGQQMANSTQGLSSEVCKAIGKCLRNYHDKSINFKDKLISAVYAMKLCENSIVAKSWLGKYFCFSGDTNVLTDLGYVKIKDLNPKVHKVVSYNEKYSTLHLNGFEEPLSSLAESFHKITITNNDKVEVIKTTADHRFYVKTGTIFTYIEAEKLIIGNELLNSDFTLTKVVGNEKVNEKLQVYSINVFNDDNYFVGNNLNVLVHNEQTCYGWLKVEIAKLKNVTQSKLHPSEVLTYKNFTDDLDNIIWVEQLLTDKEFPKLVENAIRKSPALKGRHTLLPSKGGLHEWLPVAQLKVLVSECETFEAFQSVVDVCVNARSIVNEVKFTSKKVGIPRPGWFYGHTKNTALKIEAITHSDPFHKRLEEAAYNALILNRHKGFKDPAAMKAWLKSMKSICEEYFSTDPGSSKIADFKHHAEEMFIDLTSGFDSNFGVSF